MQITITLADSLEPQREPFASDADFVGFIVTQAAQAYKWKHGTETLAEAIAAAREAFNSTVTPPAPRETPE